MGKCKEIQSFTVGKGIPESPRDVELMFWPSIHYHIKIGLLSDSSTLALDFLSRAQRHLLRANTMLLPRLQPPLRAAITSIARFTQQSSLNEAFAQLAIRSPVLTFVRHASHAQQGAVNKAKDGPGKRLGAKKSGGLSSPPILNLEMDKS